MSESVREVLEELISQGWFGKVTGRTEGKFFDNKEDVDKAINETLLALQSLILGAVGKEKKVTYKGDEFVPEGYRADGYNQAITETKSNLAKLFEKEE